MNRSISIVVPAYNEESRLPETLRRIDAYLTRSGWIFAEILVVDDGSTDRTALVAEEFAGQHAHVRVLRNGGNRGKGYSIRHGMENAVAEWCLFTDADLSSPIEELENLWRAAEERRADVVIGSRALDPSLIGVHQPGMRESAGRIFNLVMRVVVRLNISDTQCGFKLFRAEAAHTIFGLQRLERFGFDVEVLYLARHLGYKIEEVPVRWNHVEGSKVGMFTGLRAFVELAEIRMNSLQGKYR